MPDRISRAPPPTIWHNTPRLIPTDHQIPVQTSRLSPLFGALLLAGCDFGGINLSPFDIGIEEDLGDNIVVEGSKEFVSCNQGSECKYLWGEAFVWLDTNARFAVAERDASTMTAYSPDPDRHKEEVQYRASLVPQPGGVSTIRVEAFCTEACRKQAVEQMYKFNEYLRNHKRALEQGLVDASGYEEPELPRTAVPEVDDDPALSDLPLTPEYPQGNHEVRARASLKGAGCLGRSKVTLLRSAKSGEELYEVECLTGVRTMVFRCVRNGCDILK